MSIEEFNQRYRICVLVDATQDATLVNKIDLKYAEIEDILSTINFAVYDQKTNEEVLLYDGDNQTKFLEEVYEKFEITE